MNRNRWNLEDGESMIKNCWNLEDGD